MVEGFLQVRMLALFGAKNFGFFEIYGVSAQTKGRGVEPVRTFCGFDFVRTSFMYGSLSNRWPLLYGVLQQCVELLPVA